MNDLIKITLAAAVLALFLSSGVVARSAGDVCTGQPVPSGPISEYEFLKAHGLTQDSFSIWLKEHSAWRRQYSEDLEQFSFIHKKGFETERQGE